ncbi:MoeA2 [Desulforapulum autotrophicum HRM2]|uniref:Molybdopterin molybdenumtransferase n=1 Tax=Desulforapulum autotrophicum (strain ATCC 43914 / DSM 3382 / VKM B-1955 / HRM2) TaxID=177437 RepID=C0QFJ6_DESAH|nr:molybdopterin biosynthesis protein [Desulforapulum autotrophicum]ACN13392.1 MoeA2 [Desulforapulum autotrophicum HRM2]
MTSKRNIYLKMKSIEEAKKILFDKFSTLATMGSETISSVEAQGRVLVEPAVAALSSPNFHAAAMDGIAVDAGVTFGASPDAPIVLHPGADAFWVNTGHVMPEGTNAVIMIENLNILDDQGVEIEAPVFPWQNVRKMGEDIVATELLFPRGHTITAYSMGALVSGGVFSVCVRKRPNVLIIPTGNELRQWEKIQQRGMVPGEVIDSNSHVLAALCRDHGATSLCHTLLKDNLETMTAAVEEAIIKGVDMVLIIGGSSAGSEDFAKPIVEALGEVLLHGVTMMPGKPVLFGTIQGKPVFGIPGYPVSAIVAFEQFAGPLLLSMQGLYRPDREKAMVIPGRKMASKLGQEEFVRVKIGSVDGRLIASQLPRGAGSITTLTRADGIIRIPADTEGIQEGVPVEAEFLRPRIAIEKTIVITGSHDNTLDVLADQIRRTANGVSISSSHVGSMGGLMAIKKGTCHMAGAHLLDPDDGSYNLSYIKRYLPGESVWVVNLVMRDQGLMVPRGNPRGIQGMEDLKSKDLMFINRQAGSGTRILFDYKLGALGLKPDDIKGYTAEEYTHMSVAVAVLSGRADAGLGIHAAAKALELDFIPVVTEEYDLIIPDRFFNTDKVQTLIETIRTDAFKSRVQSLGGYGTEKTGEIIFKS